MQKSTDFTSSTLYFFAACLNNQIPVSGTFTIISFLGRPSGFTATQSTLYTTCQHPDASSEDQAPFISVQRSASDVNCAHSNSSHFKILHMTICANSEIAKTELSLTPKFKFLSLSSSTGYSWEGRVPS